MVDSTDLWSHTRSLDGGAVDLSVIEQVDALIDMIPPVEEAAPSDPRDSWGMGPEAEAGQRAMMGL